MSSFSLYFAACGSPDINLATFGPWDWENKPLNILAAFPRFVKVWKKVNPGWPTKATILDSGAFSAWNSGQIINFDELCEEARTGDWTYKVGLDVIGDGPASLKNNLKMKAMGLEVIPVFHYGEEWEILKEYQKQFPYIGIGGRPQQKVVRNKWLDQCFARVYPHKIHLFGTAALPILKRWPFFSSDTTNWHVPAGFGASAATPGLRRPRKSEAGASVYDLRAEIKHYLRIEDEVADQWKNEPIFQD